MSATLRIFFYILDKIWRTIAIRSWRSQINIDSWGPRLPDIAMNLEFPSTTTLSSSLQPHVVPTACVNFTANLTYSTVTSLLDSCGSINLTTNLYDADRNCPNTSSLVYTMTLAPSVTCCNQCEIGCPQVQLMYWEPHTTSTDSLITSAPTSASTLVSDGFTLFV